MKKLMLFTVFLILAMPLMVAAQEEAEAPKEPTLLERAQKAAELIQASQEAREAGIPAEEVKEVLEDARERGLTPAETVEVLLESTAAVVESGPVDNFGAFVQARLDEGLRGKELAAAIHQEHKLHGKGKGHDKGEDHDHHQGDGDDEDDHDDDDQGNKDGNGRENAKKKGK